MSLLNQDVFGVLIPDPSVAPATQGTTLAGLTVGQIGFFDPETNLAVDGAPASKSFYIALKVASDKILTSAGQFIKPSLIKHVSFRAHTPARPQVEEFGITSFEVDKTYVVKIEQRNMEIYRTQGYAQALRSYPVETDSSSTVLSIIKDFKAKIDLDPESGVTTAYGAQAGSIVVTTAPDTNGNATVDVGGNDITVALLAADDANGAATKIAAAINTADVGYTAVASTNTVTVYRDAPDGSDVDSTIAVTAGATNIVTTDTDITSTEVADLNTLPAGVNPTVRLSTVALAENSYDSVNTKYYTLRQNHIVVSMSGDTLERGFVTTVDQGAYEEGSGYDLRNKEYEAGGWTGNPGVYRTSDVIGTAKQVTYRSEVDSNYDVVTLTYQVPSNVGFQQFENPATTIIAFKTTNGGSTTAISGFLGILDTITADYGFDPLADDAAAADDDPTVDEPTSGLTPTTDGIA